MFYLFRDVDTKNHLCYNLCVRILEKSKSYINNNKNSKNNKKNTIITANNNNNKIMYVQ